MKKIVCEWLDNKVAEWRAELKDWKIRAWLGILIEGAFWSLIPVCMFISIYLKHHNNLTEEVVRNRTWFWSLIFGILAGGAYTKASTNFSNTMVAIYLNKTEDFVKEYFKRIDKALHVIMAMFAFKIMWETMHMVYDDIWDGLASTFGLFIAMYLFRQFTVGFDRPEKSKVHRGEIPPDMLKTARDIEDKRDTEMENAKTAKRSSKT
ncbi:MAG TPA: hypothetical protein VIH31_00980 [Candidatus Paceibacterota bacterium]